MFSCAPCNFKLGHTRFISSLRCGALVFFLITRDERELFSRKAGKSDFFWCVFLDGRWMDSSADGPAEWTKSQGGLRLLLLLLSTRGESSLCPKSKKKAKTHVIGCVKEADINLMAKSKTISLVYASERCLPSVRTQLVPGPDNFQMKLRPFVQSNTEHLGWRQLLRFSRVLFFLFLDWSFGNSLPRFWAKAGLQSHA